MKIIRAFFSILILCLASGCASTSDLEKSLVSSQRKDAIVLHEDISFWLPSRTGDLKWTTILRKGTYKPVLENNVGVFYEADGRKIARLLDEKSLGEFYGGVWIPKNPGMIPTVYYKYEYNPDSSKKELNSSDPAFGGLVSSAITAGMTGTLMFSPMTRYCAFLSLLWPTYPDGSTDFKAVECPRLPSHPA